MGVVLARARLCLLPLTIFSLKAILLPMPMPVRVTMTRPKKPMPMSVTVTMTRPKKAAKATAPSLINHIMTNKEYRGFYWFVGISLAIHFVLFVFVASRFIRLFTNL